MRRFPHHQRAYHWVKWFATMMFAAMVVMMGFVIIRDGPTFPTLVLAPIGILAGGWWAHIWWRPILRERKLRRQNRCLRCEYDRNGLAANARCPEYGLVP